MIILKVNTISCLFNTSNCSVHAFLDGLAKKKQDEWRKHHQQTIAMLSAIGGELMLKAIELYEKQVI